MAEVDLTQAEADALIAMEKHREDDQAWDYPAFGGSISIPLVSADKRESFMLDVSRGGIDLLKGTYQNRARQVLVLLRLDLGGGPHRNPDGEELRCPHLHVYREGYGDKCAIPLPQSAFPHLSDLFQTLEDFMRYCNITRPPMIERVLFS